MSKVTHASQTTQKSKGGPIDGKQKIIIKFRKIRREKT
jgi:hypothetical protein